MGNLFAIDRGGSELWHHKLPNRKKNRFPQLVIANDESYQQAFSVLGLPLGASGGEIRSAYRQLALANHPDHHPDDPCAAARFRRVDEAYKRIQARKPWCEGKFSGMGLGIEIIGPEAWATCLAFDSVRVLVGSSDGVLYWLDLKGNILTTKPLEEKANVYPVKGDDGHIAGVWCDYEVFFLKRLAIASKITLPLWPRQLQIFGNHLMVAHKNQVFVQDMASKIVWTTEFSRSVSATISADTLVCAGGALVGFRLSY